ncbi:hypothetical protein MNL12_05490 [Bartonella krasnovii]|uniref:hypothetical protein n=1 Tax=Bartonella krasnovii TaxID=2267275 RepID=UPI001F4CF5C0|nr:hypothetical protein [Bartonella krasnovii]UNF35053.1 hypothetical protein MNL12_05490 [Bartonella krasnovii]
MPYLVNFSDFRAKNCLNISLLSALYEDDAKNIDKYQSECVNEKSNAIMVACFRVFYKKPVHFSNLLQISFRLYGIIFFKSACALAVAYQSNPDLTQ